MSKFLFTMFTVCRKALVGKQYIAFKANLFRTNVNKNRHDAEMFQCLRQRPHCLGNGASISLKSAKYGNGILSAKYLCQNGQSAEEVCPGSWMAANNSSISRTHQTESIFGQSTKSIGLRVNQKQIKLYGYY